LEVVVACFNRILEQKYDNPILRTSRGNCLILRYGVRSSGADSEGSSMDGEAKDLLRATYLKPLRDAEAELTPGYKSRLAQILKNHPAFNKDLK